MNYTKLNKQQLVNTLKEKDQQISNLVDHIQKIEQTNSDRLESIKDEVGLFAKDCISVIRFVFELGVSSRKAIDTVKRPVLLPKI